MAASDKKTNVPRIGPPHSVGHQSNHLPCYESITSSLCLLHSEHTYLQPANAQRTPIMAGYLSPLSLLHLRAACLGISPMPSMFLTPPMSVEKISRGHCIDQRGPISMQAISIGRCIPQVQFPTHRNSLICAFMNSLMLAKEKTSLC
jgi:hypothetical protein